MRRRVEDFRGRLQVLINEIGGIDVVRSEAELREELAEAMHPVWEEILKRAPSIASSSAGLGNRVGALSTFMNAAVRFTTWKKRYTDMLTRSANLIKISKSLDERIGIGSEEATIIETNPKGNAARHPLVADSSVREVEDPPTVTLTVGVDKAPASKAKEMIAGLGAFLDPKVAAAAASAAIGALTSERPSRAGSEAGEETKTEPKPEPKAEEVAKAEPEVKEEAVSSGPASVVGGDDGAEKTIEDVLKETGLKLENLKEEQEKQDAKQEEIEAQEQRQGFEEKHKEVVQGVQELFDSLFGTFVGVVTTMLATVLLSLGGQPMLAACSGVIALGAFGRWSMTTANRVGALMAGAVTVSGSAAAVLGSEVLGVMALVAFFITAFQSWMAGTLLAEAHATTNKIATPIPSGTNTPKTGKVEPKPKKDTPTPTGKTEPKVKVEKREQTTSPPGKLFPEAEQVKELTKAMQELIKMQQATASDLARLKTEQASGSGGGQPPVKQEVVSGGGGDREPPGSGPMCALQSFAAAKRDDGPMTETGLRLGIGAKKDMCTVRQETSATIPCRTLDPWAAGDRGGIGDIWSDQGGYGSSRLPPKRECEEDGKGGDRDGRIRPEQPLAGSGCDAYATGRLRSTIPAEKKRSAPDIYWGLRRHAMSIRAWLEAYYAGSRDGADYRTLYTMVLGADATLEQRYQEGGLECVEWALENDDNLEMVLNTVGVNHAVALTGDKRLGEELAIANVPNRQHILPPWLLDEGRTAAQVRYKEEQRAGLSKRKAAPWWKNRPKGGKDGGGKPKGGPKGGDGGGK